MTMDAGRVSEPVGRSAERYPDRIAVQNLSGSRQVTYRELWTAVERGASVLERRGLGPGDRVLMAMKPGPDWMPVFLSIVHAGLVAVPVPAEAPVMLARLAASFAGCRAWIDDGVADAHGGALADLERVTTGELFDSASTIVRPRPFRPGATAVLVFTSGSTARPRAVALSHENIRANLRSIRAARQAGPDETLLSTLPPSHAYELVAGQLAPLAAGARIVYGGTPLPNRLVDGVRAQAVTRAVLVPALFGAIAGEVVDRITESGAVSRTCRAKTAVELSAALAQMGPQERTHVRDAVRAVLGPTFRTVVIGGAATSPVWASVLTAVGIDLDLGYGLTEAGPVVAMGRAAECPAGSVGRPLPGVHVRIDAGGEVLVRTDAAMQGYAGDESATAAAFEGPWLRTGDRGRLDAQGHLFITGRIKEAMVTAAGETVYPDEIEPWYSSSLFGEHAVVPLPGPDGNDRPTLVVVPAATPVDVAAIERAVGALRAAAPARLRVEGVVLRIEPLPRTAVGKVRRRALAEACRALGVSS